MHIPDDLRYSTDHEWIRVEGGKDALSVRIGITDYAQDALGDVVFVDLPDVGAAVEAAASISEVESTKSVSDIYAPVSGTVTEVNTDLADAPERLNEDPYGEGWICVIELGDPAQLDKLLSADDYRALVEGCKPMTDVSCPQCGHKNPVGARFCSSCGAGLDGGESPTTMSVTVPIDSLVEEVDVDLEELPAGVGMLVVTRGPNSGSRFALDEPLVTAGRHPDSVIFLDDITVSRRHAEVRQVEGGYQVTDVGSLNGTYLNRERVETAMLKDGDEVQIGTFKLLFLSGRP